MLKRRYDGPQAKKGGAAQKPERAESDKPALTTADAGAQAPKSELPGPVMQEIKGLQRLQSIPSASRLPRTEARRRE